MAPRVFQHEALPSGPTWDIVQEILDVTAGDHPTEIRDHALLMLFAVYGVRSKEVARLQFSDVDWDRDRIVFTRSKGAHEMSFRYPHGRCCNHPLHQRSKTKVVFSGEFF